ncbi:MAG: hypothetical protein HKN34_00780 [Gammaproteobacteria bacterium]|nr:hypothetical protein [Gammaproteobacteria bacterium]
MILSYYSDMYASSISLVSLGEVIGRLEYFMSLSDAVIAVEPQVGFGFAFGVVVENRKRPPGSVAFRVNREKDCLKLRLTRVNLAFKNLPAFF